jgi:hypothetical protein
MSTDVGVRENVHRVWKLAVIVLVMTQLLRTTGIAAGIAGYARVPLLPPFLEFALSLAVIPVAIEYYRGTRQGWSLTVAFAIIGLVDAILGESLAIIGFEIFLIPASIWIVSNIALLAILFGPERWQSRAQA